MRILGMISISFFLSFFLIIEVSGGVSFLFVKYEYS